MKQRGWADKHLGTQEEISYIFSMEEKAKTKQQLMTLPHLANVRGAKPVQTIR